MSLSGWWTDLISQQKFGTADATAAAGAAADSKLAALNAQDAANGLWTQDQYAQVLKDQSTTVDTSVAGQMDAVDSGFVEGLKDGAKNEGAIVGGAVGTVAGLGANAVNAGIIAFLKKIPIWVWLAGALAGYWILFGKKRR